MTMVDVPEIPPLDLFSLYANLGLVRVMEPETEILMRERAAKELEQPDYGPHERPWHVSFHASEFPGDPMSACKRYMLYRMMDLPKSEPMPPWVTTTGTLGKAGELDIAGAYFEGGRMLAIPEDAMIPGVQPDDVHQLGFVDEVVWMTASTDLPWLPKGWRRPFIVEVKCKADEVIEEMLNGAVVNSYSGPSRRVWRGPDKAHVNQLKATMGLAHEFDWGEVTVCSDCWRILYADIFWDLLQDERYGRLNPAISLERAYDDNLRHCPWCGHEGQETFRLDPPISGELYYWSRSWPRKTKSFYYEHDQTYLDRGRDVMRAAREHFIAGELPPRPDHFQWAVGPCAQCQFKPSACRPDAGVPGRLRKPRKELIRTELAKSHGIEHALSLQPGYSYEESRARVLASWEVQDG